MNKEEFNRYCAEIMGWTIDPPVAHGGSCVPCHDLEGMPTFMCAYDDLNQMAEVVEKLINKHNRNLLRQTFRDFIESTMDKDNDN